MFSSRITAEETLGLYNGMFLTRHTHHIRPYIVEMGMIPAGRACKQGTGYNQATLGVIDTDFIGVSLRDRLYDQYSGDRNNNPTYERGHSVNLLTTGMVWVNTDDVVNAGDNVTANAITGVLSSKDVSGHRITGSAVHGTLAQFQAITDGSFSIASNNVSRINFSSATEFSNIATLIQQSVRSLSEEGYNQAVFEYSEDRFKTEFPVESEIGYLEAHSENTGTDISELLALDEENAELQNAQIRIDGARWMTARSTNQNLSRLYLDGTIPII